MVGFFAFILDSCTCMSTLMTQTPVALENLNLKLEEKDLYLAKLKELGVTPPVIYPHLYNPDKRISSVNQSIIIPKNYKNLTEAETKYILLMYLQGQLTDQAYDKNQDGRVNEEDEVESYLVISPKKSDQKLSPDQEAELNWTLNHFINKEVLTSHLDRDFNQMLTLLTRGKILDQRESIRLSNSEKSYLARQD